MRRLLLLACLLPIAFAHVFGQASTIPLNGTSYDIVDRLDIMYGKVLPYELHTDIKPYSRRTVADYTDSLIHNHVTLNKRMNYNIKYLIDDNSEWFDDTVSRSKKAVWKVFYKEPASLLMLHLKDFDLKINPGFRFGLGVEAQTKQIQYYNQRSVELRGTFKKKLTFYTFISDNQYRGMQYVQDYINRSQAVPGQGYYKPYHTTGVDYFDVRGGIIFNLFNHIDIQLAHDKNFWGNGYRSFFLSDNSSPYFFLKINTTVWHFTYTNLFAEMIAPYTRGLDQNLPRKYVAMHHLNYRITKFLDIGIFESVTYQRQNNFEVQYLNPIIFYKAIQNQLGSPDKSDVGLDYKLNLFGHIQWYGQVMFDEFNFRNFIKHNGWWANKVAVQTGIKYVDAFTVKDLDLQAEFNVARPYTFTHDVAGTNYSNYNQPLGHPLGANFWEIIGIAKYQILPELSATVKLIYYVKGQDTLGSNYGGNIFNPYVDTTGALTVYKEYGNTLAQGVKNKVALLDLLLTYQLRHNLFFDLNIIYRHSSAPVAEYENSGFYGGVGIRLNIPYKGWDF